MIKTTNPYLKPQMLSSKKFFITSYRYHICFSSYYFILSVCQSTLFSIINSNISLIHHPLYIFLGYVISTIRHTNSSSNICFMTIMTISHFYILSSTLSDFVIHCLYTIIKFIQTTIFLFVVIQLMLYLLLCMHLKFTYLI